MTVLGLLFFAAGCAQVKALVSPPKTPAPLPRPAQPERREPPPLLAPQVSTDQEERLVDETNATIQQTERTLQSIDERKLPPDQQETYQTIHSFLAQARAAISRKDFPRAINLAQKARILSDELSQTAR